MKTDRQRIIDFLVEHPDWVDAYRYAFPGRWLTLRWQGESPYVSSRTVTQLLGKSIYVFSIPPEGEWRPLPDTNRERIINFLIEHPEWVHAYRTTNPGLWIELCWETDLGPARPDVWQVDVKNTNTNSPGFLTLPPSGNWLSTS